MKDAIAQDAKRVGGMIPDRRSPRLFLALWPDPVVRARLAEHARRWTLPEDCLPYASLDWHVTLHFIGSVAIGRLPQLAHGLEVAFEPFELVLDQPQVWPRGLAVLGAAEAPAALSALHRRLAEALLGLDQPVEDRPYRPHLTLARRAHLAIPPAGCPPVAWPVQRFSLAASTGHTGRRYDVIREYA